VLPLTSARCPNVKTFCSPQIEKERDFYFNKLRDIEITTQTTERTTISELVDDLQKILYSTSEEEAVPVA